MYLDSANLEELIEANKSGIIKGVTTNPTILLKERIPRKEIVKEILNNTTGEVFVQVSGSSFKDLHKSAEEVMDISSERIVLKIAIDSLGMELISELKKNKVQVPLLGTAIFSVDQAILAGLAGCEYVAPYVNRMGNSNINPYKVIKKMRSFYNDRKLSTIILGASFKNTNQVIDSFVAGAHCATVPFDILKGMIDKPLASASIEVFNNHDKELMDITKGR